MTDGLGFIYEDEGEADETTEEDLSLKEDITLLPKYFKINKILWLIK